jgi:hypothetical protein
VECLGEAIAYRANGDFSLKSRDIGDPAEHVKVNSADGSTSGLSGNITSKNYLGDAALLEVEVNGVILLAKLAGDSELAWTTSRGRLAFPSLACFPLNSVALVVRTRIAD